MKVETTAKAIENIHSSKLPSVKCYVRNGWQNKGEIKQAYNNSNRKAFRYNVLYNFILPVMSLMSTRYDLLRHSVEHKYLLAFKAPPCIYICYSPKRQ